MFIGLGKIPRVPSLVTDCSTMKESDDPPWMLGGGDGMVELDRNVKKCKFACGARTSHTLLPKVSGADAVKNS